MSQKRQALFKFQRERIETVAVDAAQRYGRSGFVILVLDLDDPYAREIAETLRGREAVQTFREQAAERGVAASAIYDESLEQAEPLIMRYPSWPRIAAELSNDPNRIPVAIFGDGGVSFITIPYPA